MAVENIKSRSKMSIRQLLEQIYTVSSINSTQI